MPLIATDDGRTITAPLVHLNGTSWITLTAGYSEILGQLHPLRELVSRHAPNGRDYYTDTVPFGDAVDQHAERIAAIDRLIADFQALYGHVTP